MAAGSRNAAMILEASEHRQPAEMNREAAPAASRPDDPEKRRSVRSDASRQTRPTAGKCVGGAIACRKKRRGEINRCAVAVESETDSCLSSADGSRSVGCTAPSDMRMPTKEAWRSAKRRVPAQLFHVGKLFGFPWTSCPRIFLTSTPMDSLSNRYAFVRSSLIFRSNQANVHGQLYCPVCQPTGGE